MLKAKVKVIMLGLFTLLLGGTFLYPPFDIFGVSVQTPLGPLSMHHITRAVIVAFAIAGFLKFVVSRPKNLLLYGLAAFVVILLVAKPLARSSGLIVVNVLAPMLATFIMARDKEVLELLKKWLIPGMTLLGTLDALVGIGMHFNPEFLSFIPLVPWKAIVFTAFGTTLRVGGLQLHPVVFGAVMLVPAILSLHKILNRAHKLYFVTLFISLTALFFSFSRGAWLAFVVVFMLLIIGSLRVSPAKSLIALLVSGLAIIPLYQPLKARWVDLQNSESLSHRLLMYSWVKERLSSKILLLTGRVEDTTKLLAMWPPKDGLFVIDNMYLTSLVQLGIIGFIPLWGLFVVPLFAKTKAFAGLRWVLLALLLNGVTYEILYWQCTSLLMATIAGVLWTVQGQTDIQFKNGDKLGYY